MEFIKEYNKYTLSDSLNKLHQIESMQSVRRWNGYSPNPISKHVIELAKEAAIRLIVQPDIYPTPRNSIELSYKNNYEARLDIEICENKIYAIFCMPKGVSVVYRRKINLEEINNIAIQFINGNYSLIIRR